MDSFDSSSPWRQNTLIAPSPHSVTRVRFAPHEVGPFATNQMLRQFTERIKEYPSNDAVCGKLERLVCDLLRGDLTPFFSIDEISFPSAILSSWEENNHVYAYLYRRIDDNAFSPTILIPSFIEGSPMSRAISLLLVEKGWTVLEVAMPFYGERTVSKLMRDQKLSERYATLELTPEDFCQYIEQAASDICRAALWISTELFVDPKRIAILGFSFAASAALTAYLKTTVLTHAIGLCPPVDWAHPIWNAKDQTPYLEFLRSINVAEEDFRRIVSPFQLDHQKPQKDRINQSRIFYVKGDVYTPERVIKSIAERFGMLPSTGFEVSGDKDPHITGLQPHFNTIMESILELVTSK